MSVVGLDTVRLIVPIGGERPSLARLRIDHRGHRHLIGGGRLLVGTASAAVEASLPKRLDGHNLTAVPPRDALTAVLALLDEVGEFLLLDVEPEDIRVARIDVVRDFDGVGNIPQLLDSFAYVPRGNWLVAHRIGRDGTETLTVNARRGGSRSWQATLYDKAKESGEAPVGRLRYEVLFRRRRLAQPWAVKNGGIINVFADVTEGKLERMARSTFEMVGFGHRVVSRRQLVNEVLNASTLRPQERATLLGVVLAEAEGFELHMDAKTARKYHNLARDLGIRLSSEVHSDATRLDWATGVQVA